MNIARSGSRPGGLRTLAHWSLAVCVLLAGAGCETMGPLQLGGGGSTGPRTATEQQMHADQERFNKTVLGGFLAAAAACAVTGVLIGILRGDPKKDIAKLGVWGGLGCGVLGGIHGYVTARRELAGNNEIRALQAATEDVRRDNQNLQAYLASSGAVLEEGKARLAGLQRDLAAKRISTEQAQQARQREEQNIASMQTTLAEARKTRDQYEAARQLAGGSQDKKDLDAELARMNRQVAQLEKHIADYNQALSVSRA